MPARGAHLHRLLRHRRPSGGEQQQRRPGGGLHARHGRCFLWPARDRGVGRVSGRAPRAAATQQTINHPAARWATGSLATLTHRYGHAAACRQPRARAGPHQTACPPAARTWGLKPASVGPDTQCGLMGRRERGLQRCSGQGRAARAARCQPGTARPVSRFPLAPAHAASPAAIGVLSGWSVQVPEAAAARAAAVPSLQPAVWRGFPRPRSAKTQGETLRRRFARAVVPASRAALARTNNRPTPGRLLAPQPSNSSGRADLRDGRGSAQLLPPPPLPSCRPPPATAAAVRGAR